MRDGKRETRIVVTRREDAEKPFDLDVEVDRGTASYAQPLLGESPEEFTSDPFKGWGQRPNTSSSPAYVEIAAVPGRVVASTGDAKGARRLELKASLRVDGNTWLAARCGGPNYYDTLSHHDVWNRGVFAHTSPIYVACGGEWAMFNEDAARYMLTLIEGGLTYMREGALHHPPGTVTHHHREDAHMAFLQRPYLEAREAVRRRIDGAAGS